MAQETKLQPQTLEALSLRGLQEIGLTKFADLAYRAEVARRMAQGSGATHAVLFDDVALAVPEAQRDKLHGLPGYERALLPGLWQATGFSEGATVIVAAPPSPVEMNYVQGLRNELAETLGRKEIPYRVLFERDGEIIDLTTLDEATYQQLSLEYASKIGDPDSTIKYSSNYHLEMLHRHTDIICRGARTLVIPFQVTQTHQTSLEGLIEEQRVILPDKPVLDKAETNLFLREHGFIALPSLYAVSSDGTIIDNHTHLQAKKTDEPVVKTHGTSYNFAEGIIRAVDKLAEAGQNAYIKLDASGVSGLGNLDPSLYPEIYDITKPAQERTAILATVVSGIQSAQLPQFAVIEEFVTAAKIEGVPLDYTVCGQMVNGEYMPTSINPFRTTHGVYDAEWVAAEAEMIGETTESWKALHETFAAMGRILAQNGYRNGILAGDVFITDDGRTLIHDFNFRRGGRSTPESLMSFREGGWFEAQVEIDIDALGLSPILREMGMPLTAEQLNTVYNKTIEGLHADGMYPFSTAFGYFAKGGGEDGHDDLKFKVMAPTAHLEGIQRNQHLDAVRARVLENVLIATGLDTKIIKVPGTEMKLFLPDGVWPPYKTAEHMIKNTMPERRDSFEGRTVMDVGTGSGILSVASGLMGAEKVIATDLNPAALSAVKINWILNGLDPEKLVTYYADGIHALPASVLVDTIITNPPVQPELLTPDDDRLHRHRNYYAWNEAGFNGRAVLDEILVEGPRYLRKGGKIISTTSTRHGREANTRILDTLIHDGHLSAWAEIYRQRQPLADFYLQYIPSWKALQEADGDMRIWQQDGIWYHDFIILEAHR